MIRESSRVADPSPALAALYRQLLEGELSFA